jgi:hypothetical protein
MGQLIPEDFQLSRLKNEAERRVVEMFRDQLNDGWIIIPNVGLWDDRRDRELDIVLVHHSFGVADIEIKAHRVEIRDGVWRGAGRPLEPQPDWQARTNAYALRDRLRGESESLQHLEVENGIALPNTDEMIGTLPPGLNRAQILTATDLQDSEEAIERLMLSRTRNQALFGSAVEEIVRLLCPSAQFTWDPEARARAARRRLDQVCTDQISVLERLDANRRVVVTGSVGTGKTRLATSWARRAFARGERTLLTCYNEPLGSDLRTRLPADEDLVIGAFLQLARNFAGMPQLDVPVDAGDEWWSFTAIGHLHRHWPSITDRFDTIVVDEAQDFSPVWIAWLTALLNPQGRLLLVADEAQDLYHRGFAIPSADDGWTRCELVTNCRNTFEIAKLLRRFLNGAAAPKRRPESLPIGWIEATSVEEAVRAVKSELARLLEREERDPPGILVETVSSSLRPDFTRQSRVRETIREQLGLVAWESRGQGSVVCENVHRAKGLEWDTVLLVSETEDISDSLLYVGISRAVSELVIIGPRALARRLGLTT